MTHTNNTNNTPTRASVLRWMSVFSAGQALEKIFMLGKLLLVAYFFGISRQLDAYLVAMIVPTVFLMLFGDTAYIYTMTLFTLHQSDLKNAWMIINIILTLSVLLCAAFTAIYLVVLPWLTRGMAFGLEQSTIDISIRLSVILSPLFIIYMLQGILRGCSDSFHFFGVSSIQFALTNGVVIAILLAYGRKSGITGYAVATVVSEAAGALCFIPQMAGKGFRFRPDFRFGHPDVKKTYRQAVSITIGSGVYKFSTPINRCLSSFLPVGTISIFNYAMNMAQVFSSLLRTFVLSVHPSLTRAANVRDFGEVKRYLEMSIRAFALVGVPMAVMVVVLRMPLLAMLQRGAFKESTSLIVAHTIVFLSPCILLYPLLYLLTRVMIALEKTVSLVVIGATGMGLIAFISVLLIGPMGVLGIALGNTLSAVFMSAASMHQICKAIGTIKLRLVGLAVAKGTVASMAAALCTIGVAAALNKGAPSSTFTGSLLILLIGGSAGIAAAFATLIALRTQEINDILSIVFKRIKSWKKGNISAK